MCSYCMFGYETPAPNINPNENHFGDTFYTEKMGIPFAIITKMLAASSLYFSFITKPFSNSSKELSRMDINSISSHNPA